MSTIPFDLGDSRRRYLDVAEEILKGVATGQIAAGDRLPNERSLAERCGVSRSTVREAVLALELSGVVEVRPGSGCYLTTIGVGAGSQVPLPIDASPREVLEVRQLVEPSVAHLSALARNRGSVERMRRLIDEAEAESDANTTERLDRFVALGLSFHRELATSCGNSILAALTSQLVDADGHPLWILLDSMVVRDPSTRSKQVAEHRRILEAVADGQAKAAAEAMVDHLGEISARFFGRAGARAKVSRARRR